ncbi:MAG: hypothetical protein PGN21_16655 [Sphingomonas paucimobilis]
MRLPVPAMTQQAPRGDVGMLRPVLVLSLLLGTASAEPMPQAIIDYDRPPPRFGNVPKETHFVRGDQVRIDQRFIPASTQITFLRQRYTRTGQPFTVETTRSLDGKLVGARIADDPLFAPPAKALRHSTGPGETHVGETCRPWRVSRKMSQDRVFEQSGCATDDGIELWRKQASSDAIYATTVRRTAVAQDAVRVPFEALDTTLLVRREAGSDHRSDYEVLLADRHGATEVQRRSGNWLYVDERVGQVRIISVLNVKTGVEIRYSRSGNGQRQWSWSQPFAPTVRPAAKRNKAASAETQQETILDEKCRWQNAWPDIIVFDASKSDCRTADGILLASLRTNWGGVKHFTATSLSRRTQPLSAITLPAELTDRAAWKVADARPVR